MGVARKRVAAMVFDVDGTLYDQRKLRRAMLVRLLAHALRHPRSGVTTVSIIAAYRRAQEALREGDVNGDIAAAQLAAASARVGQHPEAVAATVKRWMDEAPLPLLARCMDPALRPFLERARAEKIRLAVLSDYPARAKLEAMLLAEHFEVVLCAQDASVGRFKPHPAGLLEVLRRLGVGAHEALYVGDRHEVDGAVARAAEVSYVNVGGRSRVRRPPSPSAHVRGYAELHATLFPPSGASS